MTVVQGEEATPSRDELLDQEWDKLEAAEKAAEQKTDTDGLPADADPEDTDKEAAAKVTPDDSEALKKEAEPQDSPEAKALKDTKAWATKLAQENAELKRLVAEGATKKEIAVQEKSVEQQKKAISDETLSTVYREYPELKEVLNPLLDTLKGLQEETEATKKQREESAVQAERRKKQDALDHFESTIMPKVLEVHSDFKEIIADSAYFEWAEKQRPGLKTAALQSNDPDDIKWAVSEYKKTLAGNEAAKLKQTDEEKRKQKLNNQMTLRGGSSAASTGKAKADPNDYDSAWDQAEKEDRK
jgi:hypothetical protein